MKQSLFIGVIAAVLCCCLQIPVSAQTDNCGYPDNSNPPRSLVVFNESECLQAFSPASGGATIIGGGQAIKVWYTDEHALTLGIREVSVKTSGGTTTTSYPITATPGVPTCAM